MFIKEILAIFTLCAIFFVVNSLPVNIISTKDGRIYKLVPLGTDSVAKRNLRRATRDVFPENINEQHVHSVTEAKEGSHNEVESRKETISEATAHQSNNQAVLAGKKEILQTAADTVYPAVYRVRRANEGRQRYRNDDDYYNDSDYDGDDRKGSDVGYMEDDDDFPTVVW